MELSSIAPLPTIWTTAKRKSKDTLNSQKRQKTSKKTDRTSLQELERIVDSHVDSAPETIAPELSLYVDRVVDSVSFDNFLQDAPQFSQQEIPLISKAYEDKYMRACVSKNESECVMQGQCECMFLDTSKPFIGTQFIFPQLRENNLCIICLRKTTQLLFYHTINKGVNPNAMIQMYGNICNQDDEYHPSRMLICPPQGPVHCMPYPVVAHQRNLYEVTEIDGVRYAKQINVGMRDFCRAFPPLPM